MVRITEEDPSGLPSVTGNLSITSGDFQPVGKKIESSKILSEAESQVEHTVAPDARFIDLTEDLPSGMTFYSQFKTRENRFYVRPFNLSDLRAYASSVRSNSLRGIVDSVHRCVSSPVNTFALTRGDFYYLLYWIRLQSFKKAPLNIKWTCTEEKHIDLVANKKSNPESLTNETEVRNLNDIEVHSYTEKQVRDIEHIFLNCKETYGVMLYPTRIIDDLEFLETTETLVDLLKKEEIEQYQMEDYMWSANIAKWVSPVHGETLEDRIKFILTIEDPEFIEHVKMFEIASYHGVKQHVTVTCKECGGIKRLPLDIDLRKFFPFV